MEMFDDFVDWLKGVNSDDDRLCPEEYSDGYFEEDDLFVNTYSQEYFESKYGSTEALESFDGPAPL